MADETKRVIDQTTDSSLSAGDFVIIDSQSEGTRKFDLGTELTGIKEDLAQYEDIFTGDVDESVQNWLDAHPEATTTVQDGAITEVKLSPTLQGFVRGVNVRNRLNIKFLGRTIRTSPYTSGQGFIAREENGTLYIYTCYYNYDMSDQKSIIQKMDTAGNIIMTSNAYSMDHSNDMCSDGEYLYVCGYNHKKIYKINFSDLSLVDCK